jgi:hypothetical protein
MCPPGIKLAPRGKLCPLEVKLFPGKGWRSSVCPSVLLKIEECSPLGVNEGMNIPSMVQSSPLRTSSLGFTWCDIQKYWRIYQITTKDSKLSQNIPNYDKRFQIVTKYTNIFLHSKALQNIPYLGIIFGMQMYVTSVNPRLKVSDKLDSRESWSVCRLRWRNKFSVWVSSKIVMRSQSTDTFDVHTVHTTTRQIELLKFFTVSVNLPSHSR